MNKTKTSSGKNLSDIGIGTYGIGGRGHRDVELTNIKDSKIYIPAIRKQLEVGYNFTEIALGYGHGKSAELLSKGIKESQIDRADLFITNALYTRDMQSLKTFDDDIEEMHRIFNTDYFDSTLIPYSLVRRFGYEEVAEKLNVLLDTGKTRYISVTNSDKGLIKRFHNDFGEKLFAHETHISFEIRIAQDEGIFDLTDELGIQTIIWRPLRQNMTAKHQWPLLIDLAEKYGKTQSQIILNWMKGLGFKPEVFSTSDEHIQENLEAMQFEMEEEDYRKITDFRIPNYVPPKIDWENDSIVPPVMGFEEDYKPEKARS